MRIHMPQEGFTLPIPENLPSMSPKLCLCHESMWAEFGGPGDICVSNAMDPSAVISFGNKFKSSSVIQMNAQWFDADLDACIQYRSKPSVFFEDPIKFAVPKFLKRLTWEFSQSSEKETVRGALHRQVELGSQILQDSVNVVFEELFMNAIIDAPRAAVAAGEETHGYQKRPPAKLHLGIGKGRLGLACEDPYGSLDPVSCIARMTEVYTKGAGNVMNMAEERGGAGIGCVMLFEQSSSMFLSVQPGKRTIVACVVPTDLSNRQRERLKKSFHVLED